MPSITLNNPEDKAIVKRFLSSPNTRIITATVARLYIAYPDPSQWTYSGILGAVTLIQTSQAFYLRIVDLLYGRGIVWEQELYSGFVYCQDESFFHTFQTDTYVAGLSFADEHEAEVFYGKVHGRASLRPFKPVPSSGTLAKSGKAGGAQGRNRIPLHNGKLDKSRIGMPSDFRHVGHIGWDPDVGFDAQNIDPAWRTLFEQLDTFGVSRQQIHENATFITQFVNAHGGLKDAKSSSSNGGSNEKPGHRNGQHPDNNDGNHLSRIDSPPPPRPQSPQQRRPPPPPPPPPVNTSLASPAPLVAPSPFHGYLPRPLAQVMASLSFGTSSFYGPSSASAPQSPQSPHSPHSPAPLDVADAAPADLSPVENSLLASIRESGGIQGLRKTGVLRSPPPMAARRPLSPVGSGSNNSQGDLVSALVAALHRRQTKVTYSDDEGQAENDDDDWDADD
ncbi:hypothetical protein BGZ67_005047 [Mortierella alpina]|nr:hypothetical protein BGZ67_005047 [Mortierella alpina]